MSDEALTEQIAARLTREGLIPMSAAALLVPPARQGKPRSVRTLVRWHTTGTSTGVFLEAARGPGGQWQTSRQAVARFLALATLMQHARRPRYQSPEEVKAAEEYREAGLLELKQRRDEDRKKRNAARRDSP